MAQSGGRGARLRSGTTRHNKLLNTKGSRAEWPAVMRREADTQQKAEREIKRRQRLAKKLVDGAVRMRLAAAFESNDAEAHAMRVFSNQIAEAARLLGIV